MSSEAASNIDTFADAASEYPSEIEIIYIGPSEFHEEQHFLSRLQRKCKNRPSSTKLLFGGETIYSAMNIGIAASRGAFLYFCGDTDRISVGSLLDSINTTMSSELRGSHHLQVILGSVLVGSGIKRARMPRISPLLIAFERNPTHHQGVIYSRETFDIVGFYDQSYRVMADYSLNLNVRDLAYQQHSLIKICHTGLVYCHFSRGGISGSASLGNYLESLRCKSRYVSWFLWPLAATVEILAFVRASCLRLLRI